MANELVGVGLVTGLMGTGAGDKASRVVVLCIEVGSLADTCRKLRNHGYEVEGPEEYRGLGTLATTTDPDGVALSISQMRGKSD